MTLCAGTLGVTSYAAGIEPSRLVVTRYKVTPPGWPIGRRLTVAALADIHVCEPWLPLSRLEEIVAATNAVEPDVTVLLGDYSSRHKFVTQVVPDHEWSRVLATLKARYGVYAILGNHDWWDDEEAQHRGGGIIRYRRSLEKVGIPVLENAAMPLSGLEPRIWIAGLADQWAIAAGRRHRLDNGNFGYLGLHDIAKSLRDVPDVDPVIMLAHEPDIFPEVPARVALTLAGHMHAGQVRLMGYAPITPSKFGARYLYGHIVEDRRHLIVSGGIGCSGLPVRFGAPPEIVVAELGHHAHAQPELA